MRFKTSLIPALTICLFVQVNAFSQNFEGRISYSNYTVIGDDTIASSSMSYWIKDHLYKHAGYVPKMSFVDLGTLYADVDRMERKNIDNSGKVESIPTTVSWEAPTYKVIFTDKTVEILGLKCNQIDLFDPKTDFLASSIWITNSIKNEYFDRFVELFDNKNTLFPVKGLEGWILKREDYRRNGEVFVSEAKEIQKMDLSVAEMVVY